MKVRKGGGEEIPLIQGKELLCWSSHEEIPHVQCKRNPSKMAGTERGDQREDRLKLQSQTSSQYDHRDHRLV